MKKNEFTEENLRFQVAYTVSEYWSFPDVNGEEFKWDGDERVEQTMYGILNARQFLWLVFDKELESTINTQGLGIKGGYIIPAVDFYDPDEQRRCYVSVYTDDMMKKALSQSDEPGQMPVLQDDMSIKNEKLAFINSMKLWDEMVNALPDIVASLRELIGYINDDELDLITPKLIFALNSFEVK